MTQDAAPQQPSTDMLRLLVMDDQDLAVVSAHLQDARVRLTDMAYLPSQRRFALVAARLDWLCEDHQRCSSGLHFDFVKSVASTGIDRTQPERDPKAHVLLTSIFFTPTDAPAGIVTLTFADGAAIRLDVECLEAQMRDLGDRWSEDAPETPTLEFSPESH